MTKKEILADIEEIRHITYATFGESNGEEKEPQTREERRIKELEDKIKRIDKIIYPKYYNLDNSESK